MAYDCGCAGAFRGECQASDYAAKEQAENCIAVPRKQGIVLM